MNIATLQAMNGMKLQTVSNNAQSGQSATNSFGSIFNSIAGKVLLTEGINSEANDSSVPAESIMAIFDATSLKELDIAAKGLVDDENIDSTSKLDSITNAGNLEELANLLDLDPKQLMESMLSLLERAGLSEADLSAVSSTTDLWTIINAVEVVAPQFFNQLTEALEGKGGIPQRQAVELLTLLKTAELAAPKTDLLMKQEQLVFSLQGFLEVASKNFGENDKSAKIAKNGMVHLMESKHIGQFVIQADKGQIVNNDNSAKAARNGMVEVVESKNLVQFVNQIDKGQKMTNENSSEKGLDTSQLAGNNTNANAVVKGELLTTEESRNNLKNETLLREMQNIFKRSNFGQTGGTNRLLIKLYPEHLGQVRIELLQSNGVMTARILASTALGKEMLDSQLHQLRSAFLQQNLQVERIDISQALQDTAKNDREHTFNQQETKDEDKHEQNDDEVMSFQEYMIELEV